VQQGINTGKTKKLTIGYISALAILALLVISVCIIILKYISEQESDAPVINLSGRQRMLSQKLSKETLLLAQAAPLKKKIYFTGKLKKTLGTWSRVHNGLKKGDLSLKLPGKNTRKVLQLLIHIEPYFRIIKKAVNKIITLSNRKVLLINMNSKPVKKILKASSLYLKYMDTIVFQYDREAGKKIDSLKQLTVLISVLILLMLIMEAFFIFRPIVREVRNTYKHLEEMNTQLRDDINKRIQLEAEREELAKIKDEFMSIATHDLRNPLSVIMGYAAILKNELSPGQVLDRENHQLITKILQKSKRMQQIISDFLEMGVLEENGIKLQLSPINLNEIAVQVADGKSLHASEKNLHILQELDNTLPFVKADPDRIEQVIQNLLDNAVKYSPVDEQIIIRTRTVKNAVRFEVVDSGPGIAESERHKIFTKYGTLGSRPTGGEKSIGLGLSICKHLIELHDGEIGLSTSSGKGTTFWFQLNDII